MKKINNNVCNNLVLNSEDFILWKDWVDLKERNKYDLVNFLKKDVKNSFKKISLVLFFSTFANIGDEIFHSIYWANKYALNSSLKDGFFFLNCLPKELIDYSADLVCYFNKDKKYQFDEIILFYNDSVIFLLPFFNKREQRARKLLKCFDLMKMLDFSKDKWIKILKSDNLSDDWKLLFDKTLQEKLLGLDEISECLCFPEYIKNYIKALSAYIGPEIVMEESFKGNKKMIKQQFYFIIKICQENEDLSVNFYETRKFFNFLKHFFKRSKLYYDFIHFIVFDNKFFIVNTEMLDFAISLLQLCKKNKKLDSCVCELEKLIDDYCKRKQKQKQKDIDLEKEKSILREKEESLYKKMK